MRFLLFLLSVTVLSACSIYQTNTDIRFKDEGTNGMKPKVLVTDMKVESSKIDYLGWVEAKVTPMWAWMEPVTKEQVDVVLADLASDLGAQAVLFPEYKVDGLSMKARGQAVMIKGLDTTELFRQKLVKEEVKVKKAQKEAFIEKHKDDPTVLLEAENDPLAEQYLQANSIEHQIEMAGPALVQVPQADYTVILEQLETVHGMMNNAARLREYQILSELINRMQAYQAKGNNGSN